MSEANLGAPALAQKDNAKLAMWLFLGGEVVFFVTLILTYVYFRLRSPADFAEVRAAINLPLIALNTVILLSSSYMLLRAVEAIRAGKVGAMRIALVAVFVLGTVFLVGQASEWSNLFADGFGIDTIFGTPFFTVTGVHGTHVLVGLIWLAVIVISAWRGAYTESNHRGLEQFSLYWHFVDLVWGVIFVLFYLV
jgi:heme/copper-type cytochrome/quinol oxidase subunit 3